MGPTPSYRRPSAGQVLRQRVFAIAKWLSVLGIAAAAIGSAVALRAPLTARWEAEQAARATRAAAGHNSNQASALPSYSDVCTDQPWPVTRIGMKPDGRGGLSFVFMKGSRVLAIGGQPQIEVRGTMATVLEPLQFGGVCYKRGDMLAHDGQRWVKVCSWR